MPSSKVPVGLVTALLAAAAFVACTDSPTTPSDTVPVRQAAVDSEAHTTDLGVEWRKRRRVRRLVRDLRHATAPFRRLDAAAARGYDTRITECRESAIGGMGFHYGDPRLIDGTVERLRPELLLYEPRSRGRLRFVAVEYIVPFAAWDEPHPPEVDGIAFHRNEADGVWILHVWHRKRNPAGVLEDWNPRVSCRHAR